MGVNLPAQEKVGGNESNDVGRLFYNVKDELYKYYDRVRLLIKSPSDTINITFVTLR